MKFTTSLLCLASLSASSYADQYIAVITQKTTLESGAVVEKTLTQTSELEGSQRISEEIPKSAEFELFALKKGAGDSISLDVKTVGTYLPQTSLSIQAGDSYQGIPKTIAGYPYRVFRTTDGLDNPGAQEAARMVEIQRLSKIDTPTNSAEWNVVGDPEMVEGNKQDDDAYGALDQKIPHGQERFVAYALPDYTTENPEYSILDTATINVFPMITARTEGSPTGPLGSISTNFQYELSNIYPGLSDGPLDSYCAILFYKGPKKAVLTADDLANHLVGSKIPTHTWDTPRGQDLRPFPVADMNKVFTDSGEYSIEIVQVTAHGIDRPLKDDLTALPQIEYVAPIKINAILNTAE